MSLPEWIRYNRSQFSQETLRAMLERQEAVWDTMRWMDEITSGTYVSPEEEHYVSVEEGTADMNADVVQFGTVYCFDSRDFHSDLYRRSQQFQQNVHSYGTTVFHDKSSRAWNATEIWLQTAILVALPSRRVADFRMKFSPKVPTPEYATLECVACKSIASRTTVRKETADAFKTQGVPFKCKTCRDAEQPFRPPILKFSGLPRGEKQ